MLNEEAKLLRERFSRIRRIKMLLRPLPRKSNIHRYPILRWFATTARERIYLWSFRNSAVVPAFIVGCILSLLPVYGIQIPLAFLLALVLRANLPIFVGLQMITNPLTVAPIYYVNYSIGRHFLILFGKRTEGLTISEVKLMLERIATGEWGENLHIMASVWLLTCLGGVIIGLFLGVVSSYIYRFMAWRATKAYERLRELQRIRELSDPNTKHHFHLKPHTPLFKKKDSTQEQ
jgi:hypothetical protein